MSGSEVAAQVGLFLLSEYCAEVALVHYAGEPRKIAEGSARAAAQAAHRQGRASAKFYDRPIL